MRPLRLGTLRATIFLVVSARLASRALLISNFVRRVGTTVRLPMGRLQGPTLCF
jgi:hypothetical protein